MNQNQKIEQLKSELLSWEKFKDQYDEHFKRGYVAGAIESLKRAIQILEEK